MHGVSQRMIHFYLITTMYYVLCIMYCSSPTAPFALWPPHYDPQGKLDADLVTRSFWFLVDHFDPFKGKPSIVCACAGICSLYMQIDIIPKTV